MERGEEPLRSQIKCWWMADGSLCDPGAGGEGRGEGGCAWTNRGGVRFALPKREGEGGLSPSSAALTVPGHVPSHKLRTEGGEEKHTHTPARVC